MKLIYFLFFLIFSTQLIAQKLNGKIIDSLIKRHNTPEFELKLTNQSNNKIYFQKTNQNQEFEFKELEKGLYKLQILNEEYKENIFKIDLNKNINEIFYVEKFCQYRANKSKVCPNCISENDVIPIFYGLTTGRFMKKNKKKYHFAGCEISNCDPKWYCKKDKLEF
ncbi:hypothetical protein G6R40_02810 [Chryseobacterium sp. POL2]|uniref:hypothetical protein n=1 Tax=Chryseobacterium sp. POL2 TaxID=2713414 RepID=UPI0013E1B7DB|nr:hypothetical protein [Chryseobacterium sp. POL2]QIG88662.1 hypothetical protein G6R40_02810 [Chryseobacterium sp. POL2]